MPSSMKTVVAPRRRPRPHPRVRRRPRDRQRGATRPTSRRAHTATCPRRPPATSPATTPSSRGTTRSPRGARPTPAREQGSKATQAATVTIPVAFHVLRKDTTVSGGNIPQALDRRPDRRAQRGVRPSGFPFELESTTRTTASQWFKMAPTSGNSDSRFFRGSGKEFKMKQALHEGDARDAEPLHRRARQSLLGWACLPSDFDAATAPSARFLDGVVLDYRSLPGGPLRSTTRATPPPTRSVTGSGSTAHLPGRLHRSGRLRRRHRLRGVPGVQLPVGRDTCPPSRASTRSPTSWTTPGRCMTRFTPGPGRAHAHPVGRLPRVAGQRPSAEKCIGSETESKSPPHVQPTAANARVTTPPRSTIPGRRQDRSR